MVLIAIGIAGLISGQGVVWANQTMASVREAGPPAFVLVGTLAMCLFVPKTLVSIAAGSVLGFWVGAPTLTATAFVSAWLNYQLGRWSLAETRPNHSVDAESLPDAGSDSIDANAGEGKRWKETLCEIQSIARDAGLGLHLLVRLSPVPTTIISYSMGASRSRQVPYLFAALLATVPQWLWVQCGAMAKEAVTVSDGPWVTRWAGLILSVLAAVVLSVWVPRQIWLHRSQRLAVAKEAV